MSIVMQRSPTLLFSLAVTALLALGAPLPHTPAHAQPAPATWQVIAGGGAEDSPVGVARYFPDTLAIHTGDTVSWSIMGPHTVTFLAGAPRPAFLVPGPAAGDYTSGPGFAPIPPEAASDTLAYDGGSLISSGAAPPDAGAGVAFALTFTQPGVYAYLCLLHNGMRGTVTVLAPGAALPETPAQASARAQATLSDALARTSARLAALQQLPAAGAAGARVHTVQAGAGDAAGDEIVQFFPQTLTVHRGDVVVWNSPDPWEPHTVTFTSGAPPPAFGDVRPGPDGAPQLVLTREVAGATGGSVYTGSGYLNSGVLWPEDGDGLGFATSFTLTIDAPAGTYSYLCLVHGSESGGMRGTVTVVE